MIAPASPSSVCPTIFGIPDVPEVSISHSVAPSVFHSTAARSGRLAPTTRYAPASHRCSGRSVTMASISASASRAWMRSGSRSGGHRSMRRATPSSSIIASADSSCPDVASSTERPDSSRDLPTRQLCLRMSVSDTPCRASEIVRPFSSGPRYSRSAKISGGDILVCSDEFADGRREGGVLSDSERINAEIVLQPRDENCERQRVEPGFVQRQIVLERRKRDLLLFSDPLDRRENPRPYRHGTPHLSRKRLFEPMLESDSALHDARVDGPVDRTIVAGHRIAQEQRVAHDRGIESLADQPLLLLLEGLGGVERPA